MQRVEEKELGLDTLRKWIDKGLKIIVEDVKDHDLHEALIKKVLSLRDILDGKEKGGR